MQSSDRSDEELLAAWRCGDRQAGDRLCRRLQPVFRRWLASRVPPCDIDDVLQRMWIDVVGKLRREGDASTAQTVLASLFGFARFAALRHHRELRRLARTDGPSPDTYAAGPDRPDDNDETLVVALRRLPDTTRALLHLRYAEGLPTHELALRYDIPEGTIRSRLHAARRRLGDILDRLDAHGERRGQRWATRAPSVPSAPAPR